MSLQLSIFFELGKLNAFLAKNEWTVSDVTLTVHHKTTTKGNSPFASETGYEILESSFYLLHPAISAMPTDGEAATATAR